MISENKSCKVSKLPILLAVHLRYKQQYEEKWIWQKEWFLFLSINYDC